MDEKRRGFKIVDVINVVGSIASITGITLLWLKEKLQPAMLVTVVPVVAISTTLLLGLISLAYVLVRYCYRKLVFESDGAVKFTYLCLAIAVALFFLTCAGYFVIGCAESVIRNSSL